MCASVAGAGEVRQTRSRLSVKTSPCFHFSSLRLNIVDDAGDDTLSCQCSSRDAAVELDVASKE